MLGREMNRPIPGNAVIGNGRAIWTSRTPLLDQHADTLDVVLLWVEDSIDIPRGPHDPVANQRDTPDQHVADAGAIEVFENLAESGH